MSTALPPPDSPDSSSLASSYRPFSNLPTELVQTIIDSTASHHYHSTSYTTRQATLRSLCLVSRLFRQIASPLLYSIVRVSNRSAMDSWWDQDPAGTASRHPSQLVVGKIDVARGFDSLMIQHPALKLLALDVVTHTLDLCVLSPLSNLQILRLSDLDIDNIHNVQLAAVSELQLLRVCTGESTDRILTPKTFPALRTFSYSDEEYEADTTFEQALVRLATQLDALSLDSGMTYELPAETTRAINDYTLFDLYASAESLPVARNVRIIHVDGKRGLAETLDFISDSLLHTSPSSLRLLYLPDWASLDWSQENLEIGLRRLTDICRGKGVQIVKEEQPGSWTSDGWISTDFWRRMIGEKRKKA